MKKYIHWVTAVMSGGISSNILDHKTRKYDFMAVDIRNIANRNGIYYFRCRIPANLTNGQYREVKISLNTRCFDAHLFEIVEKANNYLRQVSLESLQKSGFNSEDIVFEIRNRVSQYIKNILIEQELFLKSHLLKIYLKINLLFHFLNKILM